MSRQANPTVIGAFVVGAVALVILGIIFFGSGQIFSDRMKMVLFFDGNVAGLNVGAPVTFRGVRIGVVKDVKVLFNTDQMDLNVAVIIEHDNDKITPIDGDPDDIDEVGVLQELIERGLRAKLEVQSFITGLLYVECDFYPDRPADFRGAQKMGFPPDVRELPTIPSDIEEITQVLEKIPIESMVSQALSALEGIERVVNSPETEEAIKAFSQTMLKTESLAASLEAEIPLLVTDSRMLVRNADAQMNALFASVDASMKQMESVLENTDKVAAELGRQVSPLAKDLRQTSEAARAALAQARDTLRGVTAQDSSLGYKLHNVLEEFAAAARSVRVMADYLERHPEALLQGKGAN